MKSFRIIFASVLALLLVYSCSDKKMEELNKLHQEVLKVHDEIMVKMQKNGSREERLKTFVKRAEQDTTTILFRHRDEIKAVLVKLSAADDDMMDWMAAFSFPADDVPHEEAMAYLHQKKDEIIAVGDEMDKAGEEADALIDRMEHPVKYQTEAE